MSLHEVRFWGTAIEQCASMMVILPAGRGPFPVLYLLHGLSDDHTGWVRRTSIERYVESHHVAVVMPASLRGWYCNDPRPEGWAYEDHIIKDVIGYVDATFRTIPDRTGRAVAGLSMGGFGALMLAMRHADKFRAASSHSGALDFLHSHERENREKYFSIFPPEKYNLFDLAKTYAAAGQNVALRIDCGREDVLIQCNREFHAHLQSLAIPHEYEEFDGDHTWAYWDQHVQETVAFVMRQFA
ncbi:MAG: esterase family protein [Phycisphaerae bacterium]|nr:esterase family protein [Phycisphaerae bacterium]